MDKCAKYKNEAILYRNLEILFPLDIYRKSGFFNLVLINTRTLKGKIIKLDLYPY